MRRSGSTTRPSRAPRRSASSRLEREARSLARLSHPNIVTVHEVGVSEGAAFIVMELLDGQTLAQAIPAGGLPWSRAVAFAAAIADALACAHDAGVVHRDLKPGNVFVTRDDRIKVLDFGIAADTGPDKAALHAHDATAPGLVLGTVSYMSPEQVNGGGVDPRSDIFALGCVLYEMLSGHAAFGRGTPPETMAAILRDRPEDLATMARGDIPGQVAPLVARCLEKDPERRFQSARDLGFALRETLRHTEADQPRSAARAASWPRLRPAMAAAAVLMSVGTLWLVTRTRGSEGGEPRAPGGTNEANLAAPFVPPRPEIPAAVDAFLRVRRALERRTEVDLRDAVRAFDAAIDADPAYAPAYAGLSDAYAQLGYGSFVAPEDAFPRARAAAERALALAPDLAEAHASLAFALMYFAWDFAGAEREFRRALELDANLATAHQWFAYLLTALERPAAEAEREIAAARALDPLSVPVHIDQAYILHYYDRNDEALDAVRKALEMNAAFPPAFFWLGRIYTSMGRYDEAREALRRIGPLRGWTPAMAVLGYLYAKSGQPVNARDILEEFDALAASGPYASAYAIGVVHAGLGDRERALASLVQAYRERSHWLVWLKRDQRWNEVRADRRFQQLVRDVGLPQ